MIKTQNLKTQLAFEMKLQDMILITEEKIWRETEEKILYGVMIKT